MSKPQHIGVIAAAFFAVLSMTQSATAASAHAGPAAESWAQEHPRREEVDTRIDKQETRINNLEEQGKITQAQATAMTKADGKILAEEKDMASLNNGHITAPEQNVLNQQIDKIGQWIGNVVK